MTENSRFIRVPLLAALMGLLVSLTAPSHAATWYVRPAGGGSGTGWGDARSTVKSAISSAKAGDEIWVASGVYNESIDMKTGIALYGGFAGTETTREDRDFAANPTVLDATGLNRRVVTADRSESVTIDGFTIRNGNPATIGGGVYLANVSSATISNCTISGNRAEGTFPSGAGVYCNRSSPSLTNCTISGNAANRGAGVYCSSSSPTLTLCTITGNTAYLSGGGVSCLSSSPTLTNCTISDNTARDGAGMYCNRSSPTLTHCTISGNTAISGGGTYCSSSSPTLTYSTISNNTARDGGGVYCSTSSPTLTLCTISGNSARFDGGGVYCRESSSPTLTNCILWNPGNEIFLVSGAPLVRYSCAQGGYPGEGNIDSYPQFVDPLNGDWRLRDGSPCIDRGDDVGLPFNGTGPDMGSWEAPENYSQGPPDHVPQLFRVDHTAPPGGDGLSWETAFSSIGEALFFSTNSDEIWVAAGTYNESITLIGGIALYGGFAAVETVLENRDFAANPTILDAAGLDQRVITANGTDGVTIDGFTIRNGNSATFGGGIYFDKVSSATVAHCRITENTAGDNGGGVYCSFSSLALTNCMISGNMVTGSGGGVYCHESSTLILTECMILNNTASFGGGLYSLSSSPTLTNCTISGNEASSGGGVCSSSSSPTLTNCTISGNDASSGGGLYSSSSSPALTNCTISGNTAYSGGGLKSSYSSATLTNCILWNPGNEISVVSGDPIVRFSCAQGGYQGEGNIDAYPQFVDPLNGDWRLRDGSPCIDRGADVGLPFNREGPDMGSWEAPETYSQGPPDHVPQVYRVNSTALTGGDGLHWETAFSSIREALFFSSTSDEIWLAAGSYNESIPLSTGLALYGGFAGTETVREDRDFTANPTILDATGLNQRVITADGTDGVTIDGFTIRNGNSAIFGGGIYFDSVSSATVSNCVISANTASSGGGVSCSSSSPTLSNCTISGNTAGSGSGVCCRESSSPTLTDCMISGNTASNNGGGVFCSSSSPTLTDCTISGNTASNNAGGVGCFSSSSPTLTNCTISGNTASNHGGGVLCSSSSPTLTDCTIAENTAQDGGGMYFAYTLSPPTLSQCAILGNTAYRGGGVFCAQSSPRLNHSTISDNTASFGGGVYFYQSSPRLTHCTISGNTAENSDGGVYCSSSSPKLTNCILWNPGIEIRVSSGAPVVQYTCVQGGYPGEGNIDAYPQFVDPVNGDWRLRDGSPCIDRGVDVGLLFNGVGPDMGSWEAPETYSQGPPDPVPQRFHVDAGASKGGDGLTWETAFSSVGEALLHSATVDEIWVAAGTYHESIHLDMGSALYGGFAGTETLREDRDFVANSTILDATALNRRVITAVQSEGVTIDGFAIRNGNSSSSGGGILFYTVSSATVSNCTITDNTVTGSSSNGGGVYSLSSSPTLIHCTISGNTASNDGGGVYCAGSSPTLTDCTITGNTANRGGGVYTSSFSLTLTDCTITDNMGSEGGGGVYCRSSSPTLTRCTISGNATNEDGGGVYCRRSSPRLTQCTISGNRANRNGGGTYCADRSSPTLTGCRILDNTGSTYGGGVYCGGSSASLIDCTISGNTASIHGGGVFSSHPSVSLTHCRITSNLAGGAGGGVYCSSSPPTLTYCTISDNVARLGGGVYCSNSSATLPHCSITDNMASFGGGVYCNNSSPTLTDCIISGNSAIDHHGGGVYCNRSSPTLTQCTISGNTASRDGGGIYSIDRSSPSLSHCTITDNTAIGDGSGVASFLSSSPTLINCILWNGGDEVYPNSATAEVTFSAVQGGYPGQGNIDEDPMFVDPEQSDYRLAMGSPCIDSGSNGAVLRLGPSQLAMGDHLGRMRIWDGDADGIAVVDMGAYEFGPPPVVGDIGGDSRVNHLDLFRFQEVWKQEGEGALPEADQDGDRTIGAADLVILLHTWGAVTGP